MDRVTYYATEIPAAATPEVVREPDELKIHVCYKEGFKSLKEVYQSQGWRPIRHKEKDIDNGSYIMKWYILERNNE